MRTLLIISGTLLLSLVSVIPSVAGPCSQQSEAPGIFVPDRSCVQFGFGYQYQHYDAMGRTFVNNGYNTNVSIHLFDAITGAVGRLAAGAEGTAAFGFGGHTGGTPDLGVRSLFIGGGPRLAIESGSRFEPWAHGLVGWERFRFTQTATLGASSALAFMFGGGLDFKLKSRIAWRVQADYLGTLFQSSEQSNYSIGSGLIFRF